MIHPLTLRHKHHQSRVSSKHLLMILYPQKKNGHNPTKNPEWIEESGPCREPKLQNSMSAEQTLIIGLRAPDSIRDAKRQNRLKLESQYNSSETRHMWQGLQAIMNYQGISSCVMPTETSLPDGLNTFYNRFEATNTEPSSRVPTALQGWLWRIFSREWIITMLPA